MFSAKITIYFLLIFFLVNTSVYSKEKILVFNFNKKELTKLKAHSIKKKQITVFRLMKMEMVS